jgi:hypothetical protein
VNFMATFECIQVPVFFVFCHGSAHANNFPGTVIFVVIRNSDNPLIYLSFT